MFKQETRTLKSIIKNSHQPDYVSHFLGMTHKQENVLNTPKYPYKTHCLSRLMVCMNFVHKSLCNNNIYNFPFVQTQC